MENGGVAQERVPGRRARRLNAPAAAGEAAADLRPAGTCARTRPYPAGRNSPPLRQGEVARVGDARASLPRHLALLPGRRGAIRLAPDNPPRTRRHGRERSQASGFDRVARPAPRCPRPAHSRCELAHAGLRAGSAGGIQGRAHPRRAILRRRRDLRRPVRPAAHGAAGREVRLAGARPRDRRRPPGRRLRFDRPLQRAAGLVAVPAVRQDRCRGARRRLPKWRAESRPVEEGTPILRDRHFTARATRASSAT